MEEVNEKIQTYQFNGRRGCLIMKSQYEAVKGFILSNTRVKKEITLIELLELSSELEAAMQYKGEISKFILVVKEDLQVRGLINVKTGIDFCQRIMIRNGKSIL